MGFYGNLTNTAHTQFQFDKVYPNRYSMERNIATDGVYLGRYVLVEYDATIHEDNIKTAYLYDNKFYVDINHTHQYVLNTYVAELSGVVNNTNFKNYFIEENGIHRPASGYDAETIYFSLDSGNLSYGIEQNEILQSRNTTGTLTGQFYKCIGVDEQGFAVFSLITEAEDNNYLINYQIDINYFGPRAPEGAYSRAWDSTVWQKIYAAGEVKYLMIAELNTASPSFSVVFDAPTQTPLAPHVDTSSSNNVYQVHLQPSWGFRIKEAEDEEHSDAKVQHVISTYDSKTNRVDQQKTIVDGAIYWNNDGIDIAKSVHSTIPNYISLEPTGESGLLYATHKGYIPTEDTSYQEEKTYYRYNENFLDYTVLDTSTLTGQTIEDPTQVYEYTLLPTKDINELTISIPAFGNAIADVYDLIYGFNPYNKNIRYRDTAWKYYRAGGKDGDDVVLGGLTKDRKTMAGSINYLHDLEGMIIYYLDSLPTEEEVQTLSSEFIYYLPGTGLTPDEYFMRCPTYQFNTNLPYQYILIDQATDPYIANCYFTVINNAEEITADNLAPDLGNNSFDSSKTYYKRSLTETSYKQVGYLTNYLQHQYYYKIGSNYYMEHNNNFIQDREYYFLDGTDRYRTASLNESVSTNHHYYIDKDDIDSLPHDSLGWQTYHEYQMVPIGWYDTEDVMFQAEKNYYLLDMSSRVPRWSLYTDYSDGDVIPSSLRLIELDAFEPDVLVDDLHFPPGLETYKSVLTLKTENTISFKESYRANTFYYFDAVRTVPTTGNNSYVVYDYILDTSDIYTTDREYYAEEPSLLTTEELNLIYKPNTFFYFNNDDGEHDPFKRNFDPNDPDDRAQSAMALAHLDDGEYPRIDRFYWAVELGEPQYYYNSDTNEWMYMQSIEGYHRVTITSLTGQFIYPGIAPDYIDYLSPETASFVYYYQDATYPTIYHMIDEAGQLNTLLSSKTPVYRVNTNPEIEGLSNDDFYLANKYYYIEENNVLLDTNIIRTEGRLYFDIPILENGLISWAVKIKFYVPEKYYYQSGNLYILDTANVTAYSYEEPDWENAARIYYEKDVYRVASDILGNFSSGAAWNPRATIIPCTVTLGTAEPYYYLKSIGNVDSGTTSVNGLILRYNQMLSDGEALTRSNATVQGMLNIYKDVIGNIEQEMEPNRLLTSDTYGRITYSDYSIQQLVDRIIELERKVDALEHA